MDGWTVTVDGWIDWMNIYSMDRKTDGGMDVQMDGQRMDEWWLDAWICSMGMQTDGWTDGWIMDRETDGWIIDKKIVDWKMVGWMNDM